MNITRHNYEAFFLLYVDNELSATEKNAVEIFIQQNPDLKHELQLLQSTILLPESNSFDKDLLLRIDTPTQEKLLLLLDEELNIAEKKELENQIIKDTTIAKEWALLQQLKSADDESILFPDKTSLYKTTHERVFYFDWRKLAIAAAFIGIIVWIGFLSFTKKGSIPDKGVTVKNKPVPQNDSFVVQPAEKQSASSYNPKDTGHTKATQHLAEQINKQTIKTKQELYAQKNLIAANKLPKSNSVTTDIAAQNIFVDSSNKNNASTVSLQRLNDKVSVLQNDITFNNKAEEKITPDNKNIYAVSASLKDNIADENNTNDDHVLFIPVKKIQNTKAGRFLSKLKNAGKKGIHIANIEFAIQQ